MTKKCQILLALMPHLEVYGAIEGRLSNWAAIPPLADK